MAYKLKIGNNSSFDNSTAAVFKVEKVVEDGNSTSTKVAKFEVTYTYLKYTKEIYNPCDLQVKVTVGVDSSTNNLGSASYDDLKGMFLGNLVELYYGSTTVATNYFVYHMKPIFKSIGKPVEVELTICSLDKLLTMDKYSKAFTARKLSSYIFDESIKEFKYKNLQGEDATIPTKKKLQIIGGKRVVLDNNNKPVYENGKPVYKDVELIVPYVVQYDESFYDFLVRIANRFGEFLYFEDGYLCLGMEMTTDNYYIDKKKEGAEKDEVTNIRDFSDGKQGLLSYYYEEDVEHPVDVKDAYYSYIHRADDGSKTGMTEPALYNSNPVPADEYLATVEKDGFTSWGGLYHQHWEKQIIMPIVLKALAGKSVSDILANLIISFSLGAWNMRNMAVKLNTLCNTANDYKNYGTEQRSGDTIAQFSSVDGLPELTARLQFLETDPKLKEILDSIKGDSDEAIDNLNNLFYTSIKAAKREISRRPAVWLDFGTSYSTLKLGDKIRLAGQDYVVVKVEGSFINAEHSLKIKAIPLLNLGEMKVAIPPLLPGKEIRKASPQVAFVSLTGVMDPDRLGRTRIVYPWQSPGSDPSPWIRIATPMNTNGGGVNFKPNPNDEAIVNYEEGNIDRPYVVGFMQSGYCKQKWGALPDRGIMSKNGHSLTFNDPVNESTFFTGWLPAWTTMQNLFPSEWIAHGMTDSTGHQAAVDLTGGFTITDRYGLYRIMGSSDGRIVSIASPMGDVAISAFTGITLAAPNGDIKLIGKNVSIMANNNVTIMSGLNLKDKKAKSASAGEAVQKAWQRFGRAFRDTFFKETLDKCLDLTFFRTVLEVIIRPVGGVTKIKSLTFLQLEAGRGLTEIPGKNPYGTKRKNKTVVDTTNMETVFREFNPKLHESINILGRYKTVVATFIAKFNDMARKLEAYKKISTRATELNRDEKIITFETIKRKVDTNVADVSTLQIVDADLNFTQWLQEKQPLARFTEEPKNEDDAEFAGDNHETLWESYVRGFAERLRTWETNNDLRNKEIRERLIKINKIKEVTTNLLQAMTELKKAAVSWENFFNGIDENTCYKNIIVNSVTNSNDYFNLTTSRQSAKDVSYDKNVQQINSDYVEEIKKFKRMVAYDIIQSVRDIFKIKGTIAGREMGDDNAWKKFVDNIEKTEAEVSLANSVKGKHNQYWKDHFNEKFMKPLSELEEHYQWSPATKGRILFSDNALKTVYFKDGGILDANNVEQTTTKYLPEIKLFLNGIK